MFGIDFTPLLVADGDEFQPERFRMAHFSTQRSPLILGRVAVGELDQVQHIVDIGLQFVHRRMAGLVLELAGQSDIKYRQRLGSDLLGQQEIFVEPQSVTLEVVGEEAVRERVVPAGIKFGSFVSISVLKVIHILILVTITILHRIESADAFASLSVALLTAKPHLQACPPLTAAAGERNRACSNCRAATAAAELVPQIRLGGGFCWNPQGLTVSVCRRCKFVYNLLLLS